MTYQKLSVDFAFAQSLTGDDVANLRTDATRVIKKYQADLDAGCEDKFVHFHDSISHTVCEKNSAKHVDVH